MMYFASSLKLHTPYPRLVHRIFIATLVLAVVMAWWYVAVGSSNTASAIIETALALLWMAILTFAVSWVVGGDACVEEDHLSIRHRAGRVSIPWNDVDHVRVAPAGARCNCLVQTLTGTRTLPLVELQLRRPVRVGRSLRVHGTATRGISFGNTLIRLPVNDPLEFAAAAHARMSRLNP